MTAVDANASLEITTEEATFGPGNSVPGTIVRPTGGGPYAGIVLMAGSGPTDRDWNSPLLPAKNGSAKLLAEALAKHGAVVLRFDKAGVGANKADLTKLTFDVYRDEGVAALAALRARKDVAPTALFVAGHSEGGIHATRVALVEGDHIAGVLLLSAGGRSMRDLMLAQLESQLRTALPARADAELSALRTAFDDFAAGKPVDPTKVTAIPALQQLVQAVVNPATAALARGLFMFEPLPAVAQLRVPVFVYGGMKDVQVDPELDAKKLAAADKGATLFIAPEADHVLKHETKSVAELRANMLAVQTGYNAEGRTLDDATVAAIVGWLAEQTKRAD
jgi:pimeloyl-ACP methyl ester carboxylesterase